MAKTAAKLTLVLWLAVLAFVVPATIATGQITNAHEAIALFWGTFTGLALAALLYRLFRKIENWSRIPLLAASTAGVVLLAIVQMAADFGGQYMLGWLFGDVVVPPIDPRTVTLTTFIYICIFACNMAIFWIMSAAQRSREQEVQLANAEMRAARSELERLRLQLNPHFMCNSLNAVSSLITTGKVAEANHMAERLADFLRASIEVDISENSLADELDIVSSYLEVEATRFGERLHVDFNCPPELAEARVPNFILQPLVENAVKHAVAPSRVPVEIRISAERSGDELLLAVENDGGRRATAGASGIGLTTTRARLAMHYGASGELTTGHTAQGYKAAIRLPLTIPG